MTRGEREAIEIGRKKERRNETEQEETERGKKQGRKNVRAGENEREV